MTAGESAKAEPKLRDAPTAKAISDKIDNMTTRFKTPVGPQAQHDANIHADGWNDAIRMVQQAIEPNLQALKASPPAAERTALARIQERLLDQDHLTEVCDKGKLVYHKEFVDRIIKEAIDASEGTKSE